MRIGYDITPLSSARTGVGHYCFSLLKNLLAFEKKHQYLGFASGTRPPILDELEGALAYRRIPLPTRFMHHVWTSLRVPRVDTFLGVVDVFHATNYFVPPMRRARTVVTVHDLAILVHPEWCSPKIRRFFPKQIARCIREADAVLACSESTKLDAVRLLGVDPTRIAVVYEGIDETLVPMERENAARHVHSRYGVSSPYLLFVGTIEPRKNITGLLRAFSKIRDEMPHKLVLVGGKGWYREDVEAVARELGVGERVSFVGYVSSHAELAAFYSAADLFVFPSLYEGFGLPILEAMACGCPVITADNSSMPEIAADAALCVNANDDMAIAEAVQRVLGDPTLRESLVSRGFERAKEFSWRKCAEATMNVYERLA